MFDIIGAVLLSLSVVHFLILTIKSLNYPYYMLISMEVSPKSQK